MKFVKFLFRLPIYLKFLFRLPIYLIATPIFAAMFLMMVPMAIHRWAWGEDTFIECYKEIMEEF